MKTMIYFILLSTVFSCQESKRESDVKYTDSLSKTKGFDINGNGASCTPLREDILSCSEEFTIEDQFALDCKERGYKATFCGCHNYICSKSVNPKIVSGYSKEGLPAKCELRSHTNCLDEPSIATPYQRACDAAGLAAQEADGEGAGFTTIKCNDCGTFLCPVKIDYTEVHPPVGVPIPRVN
jgi:hypothetical protein